MLNILGEKYYTIYEIAEMMNCTAQSIRNYIRAGKIEKDTKVGRSIYISEKHLKEFMNNGN